LGVRACAFFADRIVGAAVEPLLIQLACTDFVAARLRDDRVELERLGQAWCEGACACTRFRCSSLIAARERFACVAKLGTRELQGREAIRLGRWIRCDLRRWHWAIAFAAQLVAEIERAHAATRLWIRDPELERRWIDDHDVLCATIIDHTAVPGRTRRIVESTLIAQHGR
jgi:hypothetical protein